MKSPRQNASTSAMTISRMLTAVTFSKKLDLKMSLNVISFSFSRTPRRSCRAAQVKRCFISCVVQKERRDVKFTYPYTLHWAYFENAVTLLPGICTAARMISGRNSSHFTSMRIGASPAGIVTQSGFKKSVQESPV